MLVLLLSTIRLPNTIDYRQSLPWVPERVQTLLSFDVCLSRPLSSCLANTTDLLSHLPTERTPEAKAQRSVLFDSFDPNGNGYLSLAEVDKGLTDTGLTRDKIPPKVTMRAFQAAKGVHASTSSRGADYIEKCEFRLLLVYLRQYLELWHLFDAADASQDHRISLDEFRAAVNKFDEPLKSIVGGEDPEATFRAIDKNGGGMILFDEFSEWALAKLLDSEDSNEE